MSKNENGNGNVDDVINRLKSEKSETKTENSYFSFGLSIKNVDKNETEINDIKTLINIVKNKFGYSDVKNKTLITDLLIFRAEHDE